MDAFVFYIKQGFFHVLDVKALDHVLFFIALTVIYSFKSWKKALLLITFFTIGHSYSFGLSAYEYLSVDVDFVEFLIPITILIPLILNLINTVKDKNLQDNNTNIYFAFFFGLIHGLGFSNYFKILLDTSEDKLLPLLEFALGIEFAQIVIVVLVLALVHLLQYAFMIKKRKIVFIISVFIILYIMPMLFDRYPF